ncbi:hypothetical protein HUT19_41555 (plasmid) [Streptomyces sp. NA02950]|uniref:hypothetical protein n=1 Tax=Streptomyces sp. NA02950 TaxID=2742137 RepID=UPI001590FFE8|nr:hypothetical protein [Streptomyces sp. NA02950]QKV98211.1 hypothetical protein HUT19_41555 [Streptomyces sp. NA02950]
MSVTTQEVTAAAADMLKCGACGASTAKPAPAQYRPLWEAGWRWIGTLNLFSCPDCPPVVIDERGRHRLGPGANGGETTRPPLRQ